MTSGTRGDDTVLVRHMTAADWPRVREIYAAGIGTGNATFETSTPEWLSLIHI